MELRNLLNLCLITSLLSSCLKDEIPVTAKGPGEIKTSQVSMSSDYKYQVYFNLAIGENVAQNLKKDWDLGFECSDNGYHIVLNSSKLQQGAYTNIQNFNQIKDTAGSYAWKSDGVTGDLDSTAIGDWRTNSGIYIIDRGVDEKGKHQGFGKIQITSLKNKTYNIIYSNLNDDEGIELSIEKNSDINFLYFTFENGGEILSLEPQKDNWDLLFTQYTESLYDGEIYIPYLVTGAQINRYQTMAVLDSERSFEEISLETIAQYEFSPRINQPGYNWKTYNFDEASYIVDPTKIYVIQSHDGLYYKLRFVDFYDNNGSAGHPSFEYQQL